MNLFKLRWGGSHSKLSLDKCAIDATALNCSEKPVITHLRFIICVKMFSFADSVTEVELKWAQVDILVTEPKPMWDINRAAITPLAKNILANIPEVERSQTSQRNVELADTVSLYRNSAHAIKKMPSPQTDRESLKSGLSSSVTLFRFKSRQTQSQTRNSQIQHHHRWTCSCIHSPSHEPKVGSTAQISWSIIHHITINMVDCLQLVSKNFTAPQTGRIISKPFYTYIYSGVLNVAVSWQTAQWAQRAALCPVLGGT